jgi:hypothetical protein
MIIKIKKGKHASNQWFGLTFKKSFSYLFDFNFAFYYLEGEDRFDWNKLFGVTGCILPRFRLLEANDERLNYCDFKVKLISKYLCFFMAYHWNSCRIGWRYMETNVGNFQVTPYVYLQGYRIYNYGITNVPNGNEIDLSITKTYANYLINIEGQPLINIPSKNSNLGITLPCYFGGNKTAPRDLEIERL